MTSGSYDAIYALASQVTGYRTLAELVSKLPDHLRAVATFDHISLVLHDPATSTMRVALMHPPTLLTLPFEKVPVDFGPTGHVWETQQTEVFSIDADDRSPGPLIIQYARDQGITGICFTPLSTPRVRLGVLAFTSLSARTFPAETVEIFERAAAQVALAVEHTMQLEQLQAVGAQLSAEHERTRLLLRITDAIASELALPDLLKAVAAALRGALPGHLVTLTLWDEESQQLRRHMMLSPDGNETLTPDGLIPGAGTANPARLAFDRGETMTFTRADIERISGPEALAVMDAVAIRTACIVPLITPRAKLGTFNVASPSDAAFPPEQRQLVEQIGAQLAMAVENARHYETAERYRREASSQRDRLGLLLAVNNDLVSQLDSHSLRLSVLHTVRRAIDHDYASLTVFDRDTRELRIVAMTYYDDRGVMEPNIVLPMDTSPAGVTFQRGVPCSFTGDELEQFDIEAIPTLRSAGLQTICCVPLITRRGSLGTLNIASRQPGAFSQADIDLLNEVAGQVAIAVENTLAFQEISELKDKLAEEKLYLEGEFKVQQGFEEIVGGSAAIAAVLQQVRTVAPTDATVLLLGETGTGKELLARAVHSLSRRSDSTFVRLNVAALPGTLIESELFGYEKGAFTGASTPKIGRLELAHRGTLFLDEVGDIPLDVQPKLLRALQEQEFERLGSSRTQRVDVRLIAATNRNLAAMVDAGAFRSDLYYRLNVFPITVPALRDRSDDIPALVQHFVAKFSREMNRHIVTIPASTMDALRRWHWPGNIRELENVVERAVILSSGPVLQVPIGALQPATRAPQSLPARPAIVPSAPKRWADGEREMILAALRDAKGVIAGPGGAAAKLGLKRTTLQSKMRKLGIKRPSF